MPSTHSIIVVTRLPIPIKKFNIPQKWFDEQQQTHRDVLNQVFWQVLQQLTITHHPSARSGYFNVRFPDGNFRHWKPVLAEWLADSPEYSDLCHHEWRV